MELTDEPNGNKNAPGLPLPVLSVILATALVGSLDESIQALLPNRVFNLLATVMAVAAGVALDWARRWIATKRR